MYQDLINNNEGDITLTCSNGEIKAISFMLKSIHPIKNILASENKKNFNDNEILLFKEFSMEATKYFLNHLYDSEFDSLPDNNEKRLEILYEALVIENKLCKKIIPRSTIDDAFNTKSIHLEKQIYNILNNHYNKKNIITDYMLNQIIKFLVINIKNKNILVYNLDVPADYIKIIFDKILEENKFYNLKKEYFHHDTEDEDDESFQEEGSEEDVKTKKKVFKEETKSKKSY